MTGKAFQSSSDYDLITGIKDLTRLVKGYVKCRKYIFIYDKRLKTEHPFSFININGTVSISCQRFKWKLPRQRTEIIDTQLPGIHYFPISIRQFHDINTRRMNLERAVFGIPFINHRLEFQYLIGVIGGLIKQHI